VRIRGGRKRVFTSLELRRKQWDALSEMQRKGTKRPGSHKK